MNSALTSLRALSARTLVEEFPTFRQWATSLHDHIVPHQRNNYHPHLLSHRMLALLSILVVSVKILGVSVVAFSPATTSLAAPITTESIINLANVARAENGVGELKPNSLLSKAAQNKANDMLARQYFAHNTPDGQTPWSFIKAVGYSYTTAGENLAIDFTQVENMQAAWMNSPGHRANILNKNFTEIGIGIAKGMYDNHQTTIVVQMFGNPLNAPITLQDKPTQVADPTPAQASQPQAVPQPITNQLPQVTGSPIALSPSPANENLPIQVATPFIQPLQIIDVKTALQDNNLYLEVQVSENTAKLAAVYGNKSTLFNPIADNLWTVTIPLSQISSDDNLSIQAYDLTGKMHQEPVAQFSNLMASIPQGEVQSASIKIFGASFNPKIWEEKIFLIILATLLTTLLVAIAIKRHIQHISLVANTSFVAMLIAIMLIL